MKLKREPSPQEVIEEIKNFPEVGEVVFCGYGEPFMRFDEMKEIAIQLKALGKSVRINTTGLGNLIVGRNTLPELRGVVDKIFVSLNFDNEEDYVRWNKPDFGRNSFQAVLDFIAEAKRYIPEVTITAINFPDINLEKIKKIAEDLGTGFLLRPYLVKYENR